MKRKYWKLLGVAAAVAAVVPVVFRKNEETGEKTVDALLWQLKTRPNEETGKRDVELSILPNRFVCKVKSEIPEEELVVDVDEQPACDIELTLEPKLDDEEPAPTVDCHA